MTKHKKIVSLILAALVASNSLLNNMSILHCTKATAVKRTFANRQGFTPEEDAKIIDFVEHYGEGNWAKCAEILPERNARSIRCRWNNFLKLVDNSPLTQEEEKTLVEAVAKVGKRWVTIAETHFGNNRTARKLKNAYRYIETSLNIVEDPLIDMENYLLGVQNLDASNPSGLNFSFDLSLSDLEPEKSEITKHSKRFTSDEDAIIVRFVQEHGASKWNECAKLLVNRDKSTIRTRWINILSPERKDNSNLNSEEKGMLLEAYATYGPNWAYINKKCFRSEKRPDKLRKEYNLIIKRRKELGLVGNV